MTVKFYTNNSVDNKVDKNITEIETYTNVTFFNGLSILNPVIVIHDTDLSFGSINYCYIEELERYYFVEAPFITSDGLFAFPCAIDVLMTYKDQIRAKSAIIGRQEFKFNKYLPDERQLLDPRIHIVEKEFPSGFSNVNSSIVLTLAGKN